MADLSKMIKESDHKVVFCFGRMNPPTIGHAQVWDTMEDLAQEHDCFAFIVPSHTHDDEKNLIPYGEKFSLIKKYVETMCYAQTFVRDLGHSPWDVVGALVDAGAKEIYFVCGSDKFEDFKSLENIDSAKVTVVQAGEDRNEEGSLIERASSTLMRDYARKNEFANYRKMCPDHGRNQELAKMSYSLLRGNL